MKSGPNGENSKRCMFVLKPQFTRRPEPCLHTVGKIEFFYTCGSTRGWSLGKLCDWGGHHRATRISIDCQWLTPTVDIGTPHTFQILYMCGREIAITSPHRHLTSPFRMCFGLMSKQH